VNTNLNLFRVGGDTEQAKALREKVRANPSHYVRGRAVQPAFYHEGGVNSTEKAEAPKRPGGKFGGGGGRK
jgi:hypothetical protein